MFWVVSMPCVVSILHGFCVFFNVTMLLEYCFDFFEFLFILYPLLLFLSRGGQMWPLSFECKIDEADFTDCMSFLSTNLMEEISPNAEALSKNT